MSTTTASRGPLSSFWGLGSWSAGSRFHDDGSVRCPLGEDAIGQLMYTDSGHGLSPAGPRRQTRFASDDWQQATTDETAAASPGRC